MSEPATDSVDDLLRAVASAPARRAPMADSERGDIEAPVATTNGASDRARAVLSPELDARIARAIEEERLINTGRMFAIAIVVIGLAFANSIWLAHTGAPEQRLVTPIVGAWFATLVLRGIAIRRRPSSRRWLRYSVFPVDVPLQFSIQYVVFHTAANPQEVAAFTLCTIMPFVVGAPFFMAWPFVVALVSYLFVETSVLFILAGQWSFFGIALVMIGAVAALSMYGHSRTKWLVKRIVTETETANVELRRQIAERSRDLSEALAKLTSTPQTAGLSPGDVIDDRYRIARPIGAGGMGQVYEVERISDGRRLALKTLTGTVQREALARFAREAQIAAELDAPNLVAALDVGVTKAGTLFLVMELVAGASLASARERYGDPRWALPILAQVARALAAMHGRGIVHRDLKPSNILLAGDIVKVADFGIAGLVGDDPHADTIAAKDLLASPELTRTGAILGTPLYMAPELVRGARAAGPAADIFSFGVVAYELLTTKLPHAAPPIVEKLAGRALPPAIALADAKPELNGELCVLVDRCLAESPDARPNAQVVVATLAAIYGASPR